MSLEGCDQSCFFTTEAGLMITKHSTSSRGSNEHLVYRFWQSAICKQLATAWKKANILFHGTVNKSFSHPRGLDA